MNSIKKYLTIITVAIASVIGITALSTPAFAVSDITICESDASASIKAAAGCPSAGATTDIKDTIVTILNSIVGILAVVAVVVIVIGGVRYMTSAGDPAKVKVARNTIIYAAIGLGVAALAGIIVNFTVAVIRQEYQPSTNTETVETEKVIKKSISK